LGSPNGVGDDGRVMEGIPEQVGDDGRVMEGIPEQVGDDEVGQAGHDGETPGRACRRTRSGMP